MKKVFVMFLAGAVSTALLAGCLSSSSSSAPAAASKASSASVAASEVASEASSASVAASASTSEVDAVATASITSDPQAIIDGLSENGSWIMATLSDVTIDKEVVVAGEFHDKGDASQKLFRKLALYTQDADRNVTANFTLTVPQITVKSPAFRIQNGIVKGNIVVDADGFELVGTTVEGDVTFTTQAQMDSANLAEGTVTGTVSVG